MFLDERNCDFIIFLDNDNDVNAKQEALEQQGIRCSKYILSTKCEYFLKLFTTDLPADVSKSSVPKRFAPVLHLFINTLHTLSKSGTIPETKNNLEDLVLLSELHKFWLVYEPFNSMFPEMVENVLREEFKIERSNFLTILRILPVMKTITRKLCYKCELVIKIGERKITIADSEGHGKRLHFSPYQYLLYKLVTFITTNLEFVKSLKENCTDDDYVDYVHVLEEASYMFANIFTAC